ncbi:MAG: peptide chain release factor 3 [Gemmataceae bacterium]
MAIEENLPAAQSAEEESMAPGLCAALEMELGRRRTFAIISHPDAGKTTLTEKMLLYAGCINEAGAVRGRKSQRAATSDFMEMERERGISISSTVLSFEFRGVRINLLDTPGHQDFSDDTYRTLTAADCAVMVIDAAKGVEAQTRKLFQVCAACKIPILTFINKMDRPGREPLDLIAELEKVLGMEAVPLNWPVGRSSEFNGVFDRRSREVLVFRPVPRGSLVVPTESTPLQSDAPSSVRAPEWNRLREDVELLEAAGTPFDKDRFARAELTPVFFGSGLTNFGIEPFLDAFVELCPPPRARQSDQGDVAPNSPHFAGYVFKIQANLDARHRDRVAYVRVCAGRFARGMEVTNARTGERVVLRRALRLFGQERETLEEAFPGDIVGLINPGEFRLGDTLCAGRLVQYAALPQFPPERFAVIRCPDTAKRKQFSKGLEQLVEEGVVELLTDPETMGREPILAAMGQLQFEVVQFRLETEYGAKSHFSWLPQKIARWLIGSKEDLAAYRTPASSRKLIDRTGQTVVLFEDPWALEYWAKQYPKLKFATSPQLLGNGRISR